VTERGPGASLLPLLPSDWRALSSCQQARDLHRSVPTLRRPRPGHQRRRPSGDASLPAGEESDLGGSALLKKVGASSDASRSDKARRRQEGLAAYARLTWETRLGREAPGSRGCDRARRVSGGGSSPLSRRSGGRDHRADQAECRWCRGLVRGRGIVLRHIVDVAWPPRSFTR